MPERTQTASEFLYSSLGPVGGFCVSQALCISTWHNNKAAILLVTLGSIASVIGALPIFKPVILKARRGAGAARGYIGQFSLIDLSALAVLIACVVLTVYSLRLPKPASAFNHIVGEGTEPPKSSVGYHLGDQWENTAPEAGGSTGWTCVKPRLPKPGIECEWMASGITTM